MTYSPDWEAANELHHEIAAAAAEAEAEAINPADAVPAIGECPPYDGFHCLHWLYTADPCCYCASTLDTDDDRCPGRQ